MVLGRFGRRGTPEKQGGDFPGMLISSIFDIFQSLVQMRMHSLKVENPRPRKILEPFRGRFVDRFVAVS